MGKILGYITDRLKEKSTVITILTVVGGVAGYGFAPEQAEAIAAAVTAILAAVGVFTKESK